MDDKTGHDSSNNSKNMLVDLKISFWINKQCQPCIALVEGWAINEEESFYIK